jgi:flavin reductase (DIM6/NTAB) family NADH-FMN oxidoreductase RutF
LQGALASLDCELLDEHQFSTHSIFIGRVMDGRFRTDGEPLLYFRNDYWDIGAR